MGTKGGGDRVVGISHQLRSPLLTGQPCSGSMELSTHTTYVLCAVCSKGQRNTHTPWLEAAAEAVSISQPICSLPGHWGQLC